MKARKKTRIRVRKEEMYDNTKAAWSSLFSLEESVWLR